MTQTQWNNRSFRKFKSRSAFNMYSIGGYSIDLSQVEVFEHPTITTDRIKKSNSVVKLHVKLIMKSGKELEIKKTFSEITKTVSYNSWFGKVKSKQVRLTNQEYFDYASDNAESDIGIWYERLLKFQKEFRNNICVIRN